MTKEEVIAQTNAFLAEDFEISESVLATGGRIKEDVGIDSLDIVDIVVRVHEVFGVKLDQTAVRKVKTMDDFYELILSTVNGNG